VFVTTATGVKHLHHFAA